MSGQITPYLVLGAALFSLGIFGLLTRRNVIAILISLELVLNAANLNFLAFNRFVLADKSIGQALSIFVIGLAAAEVCIALSIALLLTRRKNSVLIDNAGDLKG